MASKSKFPRSHGDTQQTPPFSIHQPSLCSIALFCTFPFFYFYQVYSERRDIRNYIYWLDFYYFGCFGAADWASVATDYGLTPGTDYPGAYENNAAEDVDKIKRGGCTLASPGGSISISDTDHFRKVNITHHGGSFLEFNKDKLSYS